MPAAKIITAAITRIDSRRAEIRLQQDQADDRAERRRRSGSSE